MKIHKGDMVKILSGKDRGKKAKVVRVFPLAGRLIAEGVNLKKRHRRSRRQDKKGEIILLPAPVSVSAVELVCPHCGKPTRVSYTWNDTEKKVRICKKCKNSIP